MKFARHFLSLLLIALIAMPFPCALACGLDFSGSNQEQAIALPASPSCHGAASKAELPTDPNSSGISNPSTNNCPILYVLNQGWSQSLVVSTSDRSASAKVLQLGLAPQSLVLHGTFLSKVYSIPNKAILLPPSLPLYLINPVLRV